MFEQPQPGQRRRPTLAFYFVIATLDIIVGLSINLLANGIRIPSGYEWFFFLVGVAVTAGAIKKYIDDHGGWSTNESHRFPRPKSAGTPTVLSGRRRLRSLSHLALGVLLWYISIFFWIFPLTSVLNGNPTDQGYTAGQSLDVIPAPLNTLSILLALMLTAFGLFVVIGRRPYLAFSADGIDVRTRRQSCFIDRQEAINVYLSQDGRRLFADLKQDAPTEAQFKLKRIGPGSTYEICDLWECGIDSGHVGAALYYYSRFRKP